MAGPTVNRSAAKKVAEGRGFEPPVGLRLRLISSQVPLTTQPPFPPSQYYGHTPQSARALRIRSRQGEINPGKFARENRGTIGNARWLRLHRKMPFRPSDRRSRIRPHLSRKTAFSVPQAPRLYRT